MTKTLTQADLRQFIGAEEWFRHGLVPGILFTEGAKYVADHGGAYWLLDEIALAQKFEQRVACEEFQLWKLKVDLEKSKGTLSCENGNCDVVYVKDIDFTDFPLPEISLYFTAGTILLPSEY